MNLINKKWLKKGSASVNYFDNKLIVKNSNNTHTLLIYPNIFKNDKSANAEIKPKLI